MKPLFGFGAPGPVAVIDIGSNSGRVVVYDVGADGHLSILALADEIEERCPDSAKVKVACHVGKDEARITVSGLVGWRPRRIGPRFEAVFGRRLVVKPG